MYPYRKFPFLEKIKKIVGDFEMPYKPPVGLEKQQKYMANYLFSYLASNLSLQIDAAERITESPIEQMALLQLLALQYIKQSGSERMGLMVQQKAGPYRLDFLVEFEGVKVAIECDGHDFHEKTKAQAAKDKKRDRYLQAKGYRILHFTGSEIFNGTASVFEEVDELLTTIYMEINFPEESR